MGEIPEENEDHFIDTNILIGCTIEWDTQSNSAGRYIREHIEDTTVHTSQRVFEEAKNVVQKQRRLAKQAARVIFSDFKVTSDILNKQHVINFVWSRFGDKGGRNRNSNTIHAVSTYIETKYGLFQGLTQTNEERVLTQTIEDIDDDFSPVLSVIRKIGKQQLKDINISKFKNTLTDYSSKYVEHDELDKLVQNSADRDILLDSYHLSKVEGLLSIVFVSTDKGDILSCQSEIEECLSPVYIRHPASI